MMENNLSFSSSIPFISIIREHEKISKYILNEPLPNINTNYVWYKSRM